MGESFTVNADHKLDFYIKYVKDLYCKHKYLTFSPPRIGVDRSIDQNALLHVWLTEYAAHLMKITKDSVYPGLVEGMKRHVKKEFYKECGRTWMIHQVVNPATAERKADWTSSASWKTPEMYEFLTWMQAKAVNDGLILESKGKFGKMQRESTE